MKDKESSLPFVLHFPSWQREIEVALDEPDPRKLLERVSAAETAIHARLRELETSPNGSEERMALSDAMRILRGIKKDRLNLV